MLGVDNRKSELTQLERTQEQLKQSKSLLAIAMRLGRLSAWALDLPAHSLTWSSGAMAVHGLPADFELTATSFSELVDPACRSLLDSAIRSCVREGTSFDIELRILRRRNPAMWIRLIGEADHDAQGRVRRLQGAVQDITERKEAADRAQQMGERLTATLESVTESFFTVNQEWRFTYVNQEAERMLRRSRGELLGKVIWDEFPEAVESVFHREYERALCEFVAVDFETFYAPLGMWLHVKAYPSIQGLAVYFKDITDSRSVRDALQDSEEQYRKLFESSIDGIIQLGSDGVVLRANAAACAMFGLSEQQFQGRRRDALVAPEEDRLPAFMQSRRHSGRGQAELMMMRGDGSRFMAEVSSAEFSTSQGSTIISVVLRDITERRQAEQQILMLNEQLSERVRQRTAQLEEANTELKAFAHSLAHDLRSPIAVIDGFSDMLAQSLGEPDSERNRHYLRRIRAASRQMDEFTEALLSLARISQADLELCDVDLSAIATAVIADLQERDRTRSVEVHIRDGMHARGDSRLLQMALENLLGNAWKFTARRQSAEIHFGAQAGAGGELAYCVRDNGAGFDMAYADKLFGNFQRLHSQAEFPGTGIGLVNVKRIISRHGGRIWAESVPNNGATFFFTLGSS